MSNTKSGNVEKQLPELPEDWKPPLESRAQQTFAFLCTLILNQPNLEKLWREVEKETGWQEYNDRLHHEAIGLHVGVSLPFIPSFLYKIDVIRIRSKHWFFLRAWCASGIYHTAVKISTPLPSSIVLCCYTCRPSSLS